jgi:hypothetical protein
MAEVKTTPTAADPAEFIAAIDDEQKRADSAALLALLGEVTGEQPVMWGPSIVGFGKYRYRGVSGGGDWFVLGFSPRKQNLTLYLPGYIDQYSADLHALGKYSAGRGCLYVKRLADIDQTALRGLLEASLRWHRTANP